MGALLVWTALTALRRRSARLRYLVGCAGLAIMTSLPVVTAWVLSRAGTVARIDSESGGTVSVAVGLSTPVTEPASQQVDGTIQVRVLKNVNYVGRPASGGRAGTESTLFLVEPDGKHAKRVKVRFGTPSVTSVQILEGLQPGDRVILSDTTKFNGYARIRIE